MMYDTGNIPQRVGGLGFLVPFLSVCIGGMTLLHFEV